MGGERYPKLREYSWLYQRYWIEEVSSIEIAKTVGCTPKAVRDALRRDGIPLRTREELSRVPKKKWHHSDETKQKISKALKDRQFSKETIRRMSEAKKGEKCYNYGKTLSEETRQKLSDALKGRPFSGAHKRNLRIALKGKEGHPHTEETKKKISESHKGERCYNYGTHLPEETRQKISDALRGRQFSEETIRKISEAEKGEKNHMYGKCGEQSPTWKGGLSFLPYCPEFNEKKKEEIREKFGRICFLCPKTEAENGRKLDVHHVDYNKQQGCDGVEWLLVPLCMSCNSKANNNRDYWQNLIIEKLKEEGVIE